MRVSEQLTPPEDSALAAAHLASALRSGWRPPPIEAAIHLLPGEHAVAAHPISVSQHYGQAVQWSPGGFLALGNPLWTSLSVMGTVAFNVVQRQRAQERARVQWRLHDQGILYMTTTRLACQLQQQWVDFAYASIRASGPDLDGLVIWHEGQPPIKLHLPFPDWYYVLLRFLAHGEIVAPHLPPEFCRRVLAAGKPLPPDLAPPSMPHSP